MIGVSRYVALGDSYAAGIGAGTRLGPFDRTDAGYPRAVADATGLSSAYQAVLGATTEDVLRDQVGALDERTELVTLTVGGNDAGFVPVLLEVVAPAWLSRSDDAIDGALEVVTEQLPGRLTRVLETVRARAPRAQVLCTGYPHLFNGVSDCSLLTFVSEHEMARLRVAADALVAVVLAAAHEAGAVTVDVRDGFAGHQVCDEREWINGLSWPLADSYHPNAQGHAAYGDLVLAALGLSRARAEDATAPREERLGACAGSAPRFGLPALASRRSVRAAAAAGLDPAEVERLGHVVDDPAAPAAARHEAGAALQELSRQVASR